MDLPKDKLQDKTHNKEYGDEPSDNTECEATDITTKGSKVLVSSVVTIQQGSVKDDTTDTTAGITEAIVESIESEGTLTTENPLAFILADDEVDDELRDPDYQNESSDSDGASENEVTSINEADDEVPEDKENKGRPKKGRKRKYPGQTEDIRKKLKNTNKSYVSKRGKTIAPKKFTNYQCNCKEKCYEKIDTESRKNLFEKFWSIGSYDLQTAFICAMVKESGVKRKRKDSESHNKRMFARTYKMNNTAVCRDMFVKTLGVSTKRINTSLKKSRHLDLKDHRGQHHNHRKMPEDKKNEVRDHIRKIPKYKSHYRRGETDKEYLPPHMTLELMYSLYKSEHTHPVSLSSYKQIFYGEFNITRKTLKKDTCNKCDAFTAKLSATSEADSNAIKEDHDQHLKSAEDARSKMKKDFTLAKEDPSVETLTFDLEKTLPMPRIPTNIIFYKRQLWLYNLGIHTAKNDKGYCFIWAEGTAGRGAQEVGSCLNKFVDLQEGIQDIRMWSDSCGGQNRNIKLCLMIKHILHNHPTLRRISLNFLVSGHSFLPNDSDFGDIEKALKFQQRLYIPQDYINVIKNCKKKNPFIVTAMTKEDFKSSATLERMIVNRKKDVLGGKVNWLFVRKIKMEKEHPYSLFFRFSHNKDEEYTEIDLRPKQRGKQTLSLSSDLNLLWPEGKAISDLKLQNIQEIMHLIPEGEQDFYKNLCGSEEVIDDIDGFDGEVDFDFE